MVNQLAKFSPILAVETKPMRELLKKSNLWVWGEWVWGEPQQTAFERVKELVTSSPVLALFDPNRETTLSADASSFGLGAVLLQTVHRRHETSCIHFTLNDPDRAEICPD